MPRRWSKRETKRNSRRLRKRETKRDSRRWRKRDEVSRRWRKRETKRDSRRWRKRETNPDSTRWRKRETNSDSRRWRKRERLSEIPGGGGRGRLDLRYSVTTRMTPVLRWAAMRAMQQPQSATSTPRPWILIIRAMKRYSHSFRITCDMCTVSLLENRECRYIKANNNNNVP